MLTQKAIEEVDKEILDLKESLKPKAISSNHKEVLQLGEEVRELKNQVMYVTGKCSMKRGMKMKWFKTALKWIVKVTGFCDIINM